MNSKLETSFMRHRSTQAAAIALLLFTAGTCMAQASVQTPSIGTMLDHQGSLRRVEGIAGSFAIGDPVATGAISMACSRALCLAKTSDAIVSPRGSVPAPQGPALFAFPQDPPTPGEAELRALIYFPVTGQLAWWHEKAIELVYATGASSTTALSGYRVLALGFAGDEIRLAVREGVREQAGEAGAGPVTPASGRTRKGDVAKASIAGATEVKIVRPDGAVIDSIVARTGALIGPVLMLPDAYVYSDGSKLVIRHHGTHVGLAEVRFPLAGIESLTPMGGSFVQVDTMELSYALRLTPGQEQIYLLARRPAAESSPLGDAAASPRGEHNAGSPARTAK